MHEISSHPAPITNAICMHCGYNISGTVPNAEGIVTCPECGIELIRSTRTLLTKRDIHTQLIRTLLGFFGIWTVATFLLAFLLNDSLVGGVIVMLYILGYPLALPITIIVEWSRLHRDTTPHPRPYPRWTIPLWALAYTIPSVVIYLGTLYVLGRVL